MGTAPAPGVVPDLAARVMCWLAKAKWGISKQLVDLCEVNFTWL